MSKSKSRKTIEHKRVFRPITRPRYLPGSVALFIWEDDLQMYNRHRSNCFYAKAVVDSSPPKMNPHRYIKTRRLAEDASRLAMIDKQNKELLKKINIINRSKGWVDTFNPNAYMTASRWRANQRNMKDMESTNEYIYNRLVTTKPVYSTQKLEKQWKSTVSKMAHMAKFTLQMFLDKTIDQEIQEMPSISGGMEKTENRPVCYMDFRVKDGVRLGRIIIELYSDYVPLTVQNFLALCKGTKGCSYKCCRIYNLVKGQYLETGDVTLNNGKGGISIYGEYFQEENHVLKHTRPGVLSMIRFGKYYNNSQFSITFDAQEHLDGKRVVFGKVVKGMKTLFQIQDLGKKVGSPTVPIFIEKCGQLRKKKKRCLQR